MGLAATRTGLTVAEYLAFERTSSDRHEYVEGDLFAMSGGSRAHSLIAVNLVSALHGALLDRPCEVHASNLRVKIATTSRYVYPDVSVTCGELVFEDAHVDTLLNPTVVFEVLSETTEAYDRGDKFALYQKLPSLSEYLLVSQKEVRIEHFLRQASGQWLLTVLGEGANLTLESIRVTLSVERIYSKVSLAPEKTA